MNKIVAFMLGLLLLVPVLAEEDTVPSLEITGVVIFDKLPKVERGQETPRGPKNSAIVNDKIMFVGDTFLVADGELKYRIDPEKASPGDDLITLVAVKKDANGIGVAHFDYHGFIVLKRLKSRKNDLSRSNQD